MSNKPFDRGTIGVREKPSSSDLNAEFSSGDRTLRDLMMRILARANSGSPAGVPKTGFVGDGFVAGPASPAAMSVVINPGFGFIVDASDLPTNIGSPDLEGIHDLSQYKPVVLDGAATFAVPAAPSAPNSRIDIIEVHTHRALIDADTRLQLDVPTKTFGPKSFFKTLSFLVDGSVGTATGGANSTAALSYKVGTAANPGVAPSVSPGYTKIAEVRVPNGTTSITAAGLIDRRPLLGPGGVFTASARWRLQWNGGAPIVTLLDSCVPPGLSVAMKGNTGQRGVAQVFCVGGEITSASIHAQAEAPVTDTGVLVFIPKIRMTNPFQTTVDATAQTALAASTPAISVGVGSQKLEALIELIFWDGVAADAASVTSAELEDIVWDVTFRVGY